MELQNYRKFRKCAIEFPDGVVGVIGPNGVGKSSLIEAIAWALYGNEGPIVRTTKEGVRRSGARPNEECRVLLEFDLEGDSYLLERTMKGKDLKSDARLLVNNKPEARGDTAVSAEIARRLGMDHKAFFISVFARQKDLNALSALKAFERKRLILRMLEIDALDKVVADIDRDANLMKRSLEIASESLLAPDGRKKIDVLRGRIDELRCEMEESRGLLTSMERNLGEAEELVARLKKERERASLKDQELRGLRNSWTEKRERISGLEERKARVESEIDSLAGMRDEVDLLEPDYHEYNPLIAKKEEMEGGLQAFEELKFRRTHLTVILGREKEIGDEIARRRESLLAYEGVEESLEIVESSMEEAEEQLNSEKIRTKWLDSEIERLEKEVIGIVGKKESISGLGPDSPCPTCERPLGEQHDLLLRKMEVEIDHLRNTIAQNKERRERASEEVKRLKLRKDALERRRGELGRKQREEIGLRSALEQALSTAGQLSREKGELTERIGQLEAIEFDEKEYAGLKGQLRVLKEKADRYVELRSALQRLPLLERERTEVGNQLALEEEGLSAIGRRIADLGHKEGDLALATEAYESALAARQKISMEFKEREGELRLKEMEARNAEVQVSELASTERSLSERTNQLGQLAVLSGVMRDFRTNVMARIVPTLSEISSALFAELTDSRYGGMELDEDYEVHIYDGGDKFPLSRFSGGEADLANLCLRLAISRVIADRAGSSVDFLILDEIFGSQDQTRKRNIMSTLNQLSRQFSQIILITHIEDVKEFMTHVVGVRETEDGTSELSIDI